MIYFYLTILNLIISLGIEEFKNYIRIDSKIYPCVVYSNVDSFYGCSSDYSNSKGDLFLIERESDTSILSKIHMTSKIVVAVYSDVFNHKLLLKLNPLQVSGILVLFREKNKPSDQSFEDKYITSQNDYYKDDPSYISKTWNPYGQNLLIKNYTFPMVLIKEQKDIDFIVKCYLQRNYKDIFPKCGVAISSFMISNTMNTNICKRKSENQNIEQSGDFCYSLTASNIYAHIPNSKNDDKLFLIISTKLDTRCLFFQGCLGAQSEVASIAIFLTIIKIFSTFQNEVSSGSKNLLFVGFDGESWDYIGSSNFAFNLNMNGFETIKGLSLNSISEWIEIGNFGPGRENYFIHSDPIISKNQHISNKISEMSRKISQNFKAESLNISEIKNLPLPPCSLREIYRHKINISGIYISNFEESFTNKYYHSIYDDKNNFMIKFSDKRNDISIKQLSSVAIAIANTIKSLSEITSSFNIDKNAVEQEVLDLFECLFLEYNCTKFKDLHSDSFFQSFMMDGEYSRETVPQDYFNPFIETMSHYIGYQLGQKFKLSNENCNYKNSSLFNFITDSYCVLNATVYVKPEKSLFFYDPEIYKNYSSWTISTFETPYIQIYFMKSTNDKIKVYLFGIITSILCMGFTAYLMSNPQKFQFVH